MPALLAARADLRLTLFVGQEAFPSLRDEPWGGDVTLVRVPVRARSRTRRVLAEQILLPRSARRLRVDLLHNTLNTAAVLPGVPQVTSIHDVIYKRYPETHAGIMASGVALLVPLAARRSRRIVTGSEAAKQDIVRLLNIDPIRIDVIPDGPGLPVAPHPLSEAELRKEFGTGDAPIVLTVAAKRPHKNLGRLIDAFALVRRDAVLLIPGFETPFEAELKQRAGERVRFLGWLDDATLDGLYRAATCFVLPSLAEGFGLPVLEAMLRGTPVACSRTSALPEVAGDAAFYFDPEDTNEIAAALELLLDNEQLRAYLRKAGLERARRFSWEATAEGTIATYERTLAGS